MIDNRFAPYGALALRVALGLMWISHGLLKFMAFGVSGFAGFLGSLGYPTALALPVMLAEVVGGILVLTGFYGRFVSLLLIPVMGAAMLVHVGNGWLFSAPNGGWEYPAFLMVASLAHFLIGDGAFALRSAAIPAATPAAAPAR